MEWRQTDLHAVFDFENINIIVLEKKTMNKNQNLYFSKF